jgi:hypothetical protein
MDGRRNPYATDRTEVAVFLNAALHLCERNVRGDIGPYTPDEIDRQVIALVGCAVHRLDLLTPPPARVRLALVPA